MCYMYRVEHSWQYVFLSKYTINLFLITHLVYKGDVTARKKALVIKLPINEFRSMTVIGFIKSKYQWKYLWQYEHYNYITLHKIWKCVRFVLYMIHSFWNFCSPCILKMLKFNLNSVNYILFKTLCIKRTYRLLEHIRNRYPCT
jgi:hypothetical protein